MRTKLLICAMTVLAANLAACGGTTAAGNSAADTVSTRDVPGVGTVLVSAAGNTLYVTDSDGQATPRCTDACARTWPPLTVAGGTALTAGPGVTGTLATAVRPDGATQVTWDGKPLYSYAQDTAPGQANGNGLRGAWGTWHVAAAADAAPAGGGAGGGGY